MSYLAQVIATAGEAETLDLRTKIAETEKKILSLDKEVKDYLENSYMKFSSFLQENHLTFRAKNLASEIERLEDRVNNLIKKELNTASDEMKTISSRLDDVNTCLLIVSRMISVDSLIRSAKNDHGNNNYLEAAQKFKQLKDLLQDDPHLKNLSCYDSLIYYVDSIHEKFLGDTLAVWSQFISWNIVDTANLLKRVNLIINTLDGKSDIIRVLYYYDHLDLVVQILSKKLFELIFEPIIKYNAVVNIKLDDGIWTIILEYKEKISDVDCETCMTVVENLSNILNTLLESLDAFISEEETFLSKIGDLLENGLCSCFMEYCLYKAIPTKKDELINFEETAKKVLVFDQFLKENGFMKPTNMTITDCVTNVNTLFVSKTCQTYLSEARKIFDKDLHDMVEIKSVEDEIKSKYENDDPDIALCRKALQKPACFISKSTLDLLELFSDIFNEIAASETGHGVELFFTVRNIINLYLDLMPLKHSHYLKSIPQQSALFLNNCMYLSHELVNLNIKSLTMLPDTLHVTFVDFITPLKSLGNSVLNSQIEVQQEQISKILQDSGLSDLLDHKEFPPTVEKSVRQCLRQIHQMQKVWQKILPQNIYCRAIGKIANYFVDSLTEYVVQLNDITLDMTGQLTNIFTIVLDQVPSLMPDPKEVFRHVKQWSKFSELLQILNGSLKDIDDRWADGKGPLAQEFTPDQLKHLIRALFQHTDRRSALLSKIR